MATTRSHFIRLAFSCLFLGILLSASPSLGERPHSPEPAPGTLEYAKTHARYAARPNYPTEARLRRWTGAGVFELHVRADGTVYEVKVVRTTGHQVLDEEGRSTFRKWRFYPGRFTRVRIPLSFTIGR
jgi:protein TonB